MPGQAMLEKIMTPAQDPSGQAPQGSRDGAQQGAAVYWVFPEESGWRDTRNNKDLAGRDRFVTSTWSGEGA